MAIGEVHIVQATGPSSRPIMVSASSASSAPSRDTDATRRSNSSMEISGDIVTSQSGGALGANSSGPSAIVLQECFFECGANATSCKLVNIGNARSPKMVCPPCVSAKKAIDNQAKGNEQAKKGLAELKNFRNGEYKALVRNSRIDLATGGGVTAAHRDRNAILMKTLVQVVNTADTFKEETDTDGALWPDRAEFIGYHQTFKSMTKEEATAKWDADSVDPAIERRGEGAGLRVKVMGIPTSATVSGKRVARGIEAKRTLDSAKDLQAAAKRLRTGGVSNDFDIAFGSSRPRPSAKASVSSQAAAASAVPILDEGNDSVHIDIKYLADAADVRVIDERDIDGKANGTGKADAPEADAPTVREVSARTLSLIVCNEHLWPM